ncbi:MAG: MEMO1 family protein [Acidaminococcaceae bacterium]
MLVFGVISPHPPAIIPDIGGEETQKAINTVIALKSAAKMLADTNPDRLLIISPHQEHGYNVPLHYLKKDLKQDIKIDRILVTDASYEYYYNLGKSYGEKIEKAKECTAVIASGDLSHVLKPEGPYGYDPAGPKLDEVIVRAVKEKNVDMLLDIDPEILEHGAECGLRSILFLFGVFEIIDFSTKVLSYEAPFGVGYMVALFYKKEG